MEQEREYRFKQMTAATITGLGGVAGLCLLIIEAATGGMIPVPWWTIAAFTAAQLTACA